MLGAKIRRLLDSEGTIRHLLDWLAVCLLYRDLIEV